MPLQGLAGGEEECKFVFACLCTQNLLEESLRLCLLWGVLGEGQLEGTGEDLLYR